MGKLKNREKPGCQITSTSGCSPAFDPARWLGAAVVGQRRGMGDSDQEQPLLRALLSSRSTERGSSSFSWQERLSPLSLKVATCRFFQLGEIWIWFGSGPCYPSYLSSATHRRVPCATWVTHTPSEGSTPSKPPALLEGRENAVHVTTIHVAPPAASPEIPSYVRRAARLFPRGLKATNLRFNLWLLLTALRTWLLPGAQPCTSERDGSGQRLWFPSAELSQSWFAVTWWKP